MQRTAREVSYPDLQGQTEITKHIGGPEATDALIEMCHIAGANEVLYVGCGIGVGPAHIAKRRGYVGMNEVFWVAPASAEFAADARRERGAGLLPVADWRALWDASGLADRVVAVRSIDARAEVRARLRWVGARWALRAFGWLIALYVTSPSARQAMLDQLRGTRNFSPALGYGLFAGRK